MLKWFLVKAPGRSKRLIASLLLNLSTVNQQGNEVKLKTQQVKNTWQSCDSK